MVQQAERTLIIGSSISLTNEHLAAGLGAIMLYPESMIDRSVTIRLTPAVVIFASALALSPMSLPGQERVPNKQPNVEEARIIQQLKSLRKVPDDKRPAVTRQIALDIRRLPPDALKVGLANGLANLSTEGDFGRDTLQEVTTTLAEALREQPAQAEETYSELAQLVRYEHMHAVLDNASMMAAMSKLEAADQDRQRADFTLTDLQGKTWNLRSLHGKVVLVNFWATWCPPCRKEMPDLSALYLRFKDQGLIILAISDEDAAKVSPFLASADVSYPILLDPGRVVNDKFHVEGIPKSFLYDRKGELVAQSIDMRTQKQFLEMLKLAGLDE